MKYEDKKIVAVLATNVDAKTAMNGITTENKQQSLIGKDRKIHQNTQQ